MVIYLPALGRCDLERESKSSCKVDIKVKDAAEVNEIMCIDSFYSVADLFLKFRQLILIVIGSINGKFLFLCW